MGRAVNRLSFLKKRLFSKSDKKIICSANCKKKKGHKSGRKMGHCGGEENCISLREPSLFALQEKSYCWKLNFQHK